MPFARPTVPTLRLLVSLRTYSAVTIFDGKSIASLGQALAAPGATVVAVLGGAKVSDKCGVIAQTCYGKVDSLLIGEAWPTPF